MKKLLSLLLSLSLVFAIAGCSTGTTPSTSPSPSQSQGEEPTPETDEATKVLFLASTIAVEYFTNAYNAMEPVFAEKNIQLDLKGPTKPDQIEEQLAMFENAVASKEYDLILLYPAVPNAFTDAVRASEEAGIPVIAYQMAPELNCGTYYAGPDNVEQGRKSAEAMVAFVDAHADHFGAMESIPVVVWTSAASEEINKRATGIKEVLANDGRFEIVMEQSAVGTEQGMSFGETAATAYPDVELYIGVQDAAGVGIMNALKAAGKASETMGVFSVDGTGAVLSAIKSGELYRATVGAPFADQAPALADFILEVLAGNVEAGAHEKFPVITMTAENADDYLS